MKLICEQCGARYSIADEKVRGKVFKIRCKKCDHVIVVKGDVEGAGVQPGDVPDGENGSQSRAPFENLGLSAASWTEGGPAQVGSPDAATTLAAPTPSLPAIWYVLLGQQQVGPLTEEQVASHLQEGQATADTFIWRDGFADWVPIRTLAEFAPLLSQLPPPVVGPDPNLGIGEPRMAFQPGLASNDPTVPKPASWNQQEQGVLAGFSLGQGIASASPSFGGGLGAELPPQTDLGAPAGGMFFNYDQGIGSGLAAPPEQKMVAARNENSVLFSLATLQNLAMGAPSAAPPPEPARAPSATSASSSSGLIDIRSLAGNEVAGPDILGASPVAVPPAAIPPMMVPVVTRRQTPVGLIVGVISGLVVVIALAIVLVVLLKEPPPPVPVVAGTATAASTTSSKAVGTPSTTAPATPAPTEPTPAATPTEPVAAATPTAVAALTPPSAGSESRPPTQQRPVVSTGPSRPVQTPSVTSTAPATTAPATTAPATPIVKPPAGPAPAKPIASEVDGLLKGLEGGGQPAPKPPTPPPSVQPPPPPQPPTSSAPVAAASLKPLSRDDVQNVIRANKGKVQSCYERQAEPKLSGTLMVSFTIQRNGTVNQAMIKTPSFEGTAVGQCVLSAVRSFAFPEHTDPPMKIQYPFILR